MIESIPMWEEKVWGQVVHIFASFHSAVSYLNVNKGFQCSRHWHKDRINHFFVISGEIEIEEWDNNSEYKITKLLAGDSYTVPTRMIHRFRVVESGDVIEVYWPGSFTSLVSRDDIHRLDEGGSYQRSSDVL